jgi:hypothetical protein
MNYTDVKTHDDFVKWLTEVMKSSADWDTVQHHLDQIRTFLGESQCADCGKSLSSALEVIEMAIDGWIASGAKPSDINTDVDDGMPQMRVGIVIVIRRRGDSSDPFGFGDLFDPFNLGGNPFGGDWFKKRDH